MRPNMLHNCIRPPRSPVINGPAVLFDKIFNSQITQLCGDIRFYICISVIGLLWLMFRFSVAFELSVGSHVLCYVFSCLASKTVFDRQTQLVK